jgi:hypothetical protein
MYAERNARGSTDQLISAGATDAMTVEELVRIDHDAAGVLIEALVILGMVHATTHLLEVSPAHWRPRIAAGEAAPQRFRREQLPPVEFTLAAQFDRTYLPLRIANGAVWDSVLFRLTNDPGALGLHDDQQRRGVTSPVYFPFILRDLVLKSGAPDEVGFLVHEYLYLTDPVEAYAEAKSAQQRCLPGDRQNPKSYEDFAAELRRMWDKVPADQRRVAHLELMGLVD